ncbi:cytochrome P450 3A41-like [Argiope bruennichi]|uniref:cytochrome P450 3A41-like n=1 Tax=Argiope bruennichi TaxID=94029 RepID=UPI0024947FE3|nr:cytochrome P450 3A41-like [Argiope bruennichi]
MDISVENGLICSILIIILFMWIRWRKTQLRIFKDLGIPGPSPNILFGNILELNRKGPQKCHKEWIEKYGKILGFYHGMKPVLLVADPELLKKILIKDFHLFCDRPEGVPLRVHSFLDQIIPASAIMDNLLINLKGEHWKKVRSILSPTFSANKLKGMIPAVNQVCDSALSILEAKSRNGEIIDILDVLQRLTLDIISAQAFAMDVDSLENPDDPLLRSAKIVFDLPFASKIVFFGRCFPELSFFAMAANFLSMFIRNKGYIPPLKITQVLEVIIKERRNNPKLKSPDLLQWLMEASNFDTDLEKDNSNKKEESFSESSKLPRKRQTLNDVEVISNALVVFLAGFETTSSALAFSFYFLAKYPEYQQQIQKEIDFLIEQEGQLDYYNVSNFQLMERFFLEAMRFYPPAINFIIRLSVSDVDYGYVRIPKGMEINIPVEYIHHSEEFWEQPEEFNPDRFLPGSAAKRQSCSYMAFGTGPRSCIGQRLVNITSKIILAKILHKFTVEPAESHEQMKSVVKVFTMVPEKVCVKLKPRSTSM